MDLSVIVPAYDEASRLAAPLRAVGAWLARQPFASEIVVVDDGSRDATADVAREIAAELAVPLTLLRSRANRGKGHALKLGFAAARGRRILFTDADLSTPIEAASDLLRALDAGADLAIGSRRAAGADLAVRQPWLRETLGKGFTFLVRVAIAPVSDATCGFKAFAGDTGRDLFARARIERWGFDAEILHLAHRRGLRVVEVPVRWEDRSGSKVRLGADVGRSLADLARIRLYAALGRYARPVPPEATAEVWTHVPADPRAS